MLSSFFRLHIFRVSNYPVRSKLSSSEYLLSDEAAHIINVKRKKNENIADQLEFDLLQTCHLRRLLFNKYFPFVLILLILLILAQLETKEDGYLSICRNESQCSENVFGVVLLHGDLNF